MYVSICPSIHLLPIHLYIYYPPIHLHMCVCMNVNISSNYYLSTYICMYNLSSDISIIYVFIGHLYVIIIYLLIFIILPWLATH